MCTGLVSAGLAAVDPSGDMASLMASATGLSETYAAEKTATFAVNQTMADSISGESATYKLTPENSASPMPSGTEDGVYSMTIQGTASADITIPVSDAGIYYYQLRYVEETGSAIKCDGDSSYRLLVQVMDDGTVNRVVYHDNGDKAPSISFSYVAAGGGGDDEDDDSGHSSKTGDQFPAGLWLTLLLVSGAGAICIGMNRKRRNS